MTKSPDNTNRRSTIGANALTMAQMKEIMQKQGDVMHPDRKAGSPPRGSVIVKGQGSPTMARQSSAGRK